MNTLASIVSHYKLHYRDRLSAQLQWFASQPTTRDAVSLAALARGSRGELLRHQWRVPKAALAESSSRLLDRVPDIEATHSFDGLHRLVSAEIGQVHGIGDLTIYDTALRIGAKLRLEPELVYLHRGTRVGAERLGVNASRRSLRIDELPREFQCLRAREIEDILCIFKDHLGPAASAVRRKHRDVQCIGSVTSAGTSSCC